MKTGKDILKPIAIVMLAVSTLFPTSCSDRQSEIIGDMVFRQPDKAAMHLNAIDTERLDADSKALYNLNRILLLEEEWHQQHADTMVHISASDYGWSFKRESTYIKGDLDKIRDSLATSASILQAYRYFEEKSVGGVSDNSFDLQCFGRLCYTLGHYYTDNNTTLQADQLYLLAIHCAETSQDYETAFRAYHQFAVHLQHKHTAAHTEV